MSEDRLRRWRLVLGGDEADGTDVQLGREDRGIDGALEAVYGEKRGGLGASAPTVARWLGELRANFPAGRGAGRAAGRDRPARAAPAAARARGARLGHARRAPGGDADEPPRRAARGEPAGRAPARPAGRRGHRAKARRPHAQRRPRRARPQRAHDAAEAGRDRLGPHDPGQPAPLPAGTPDGDPGAARRPRAQAALAGGRADPRARPEREHGHLGGPRRRARRQPRVDPDPRRRG